MRSIDEIRGKSCAREILWNWSGRVYPEFHLEKYQSEVKPGRRTPECNVDVRGDFHTSRLGAEQLVPQPVERNVEDAGWKWANSDGVKKYRETERQVGGNGETRIESKVERHFAELNSVKTVYTRRINYSLGNELRYPELSTERNTKMNIGKVPSAGKENCRRITLGNDPIERTRPRKTHGFVTVKHKTAPNGEHRG